jgi:hypothetical protein
MSEEVTTPTEATPEPTPQEAPQTEAPQAEAPKEEAAPKGPSTEEFENQAKELELLREYRRAAGNLMKAQDAEMTEEKESDMRFVMAYEGFDDHQINEQINNMKQAQQNQGVVPYEGTPEQNAQPQPQNDPRVEDVERRMAQVEERERTMRLEQLQNKLNAAVSQVQTGGEIDKISSSFKRIHGDEGHDERMNVIGEDIHREMVSHLRKIRSAGGSVTDDAIRQASESAAETVAKRYRTVIGDPNKLGRAPETASGQTQFYQKKPIDVPSFQPGKDSAGSVYDKARKFAEDTLLDIAADTSAGGNTKL